MNIAQMVLQEAQFGHRPDFLAREPGERSDPHQVNIEIGVIEVPERDKAIVRLRVSCDDGPQYTFNVVYLLLLTLGDDESPEQLTAENLGRSGGVMLMPMARECIANLSSRGRFGPVWVPPINFSQVVMTPSPSDEPPQKPKSPAKRRAVKKAPAPGGTKKKG